MKIRLNNKDQSLIEVKKENSDLVNENTRLRDDIYVLQQESEALEMQRKVDIDYKFKYIDLEQKLIGMSDYDELKSQLKQLREENQKLQREKNDLNYQLIRLQHKSSGSGSK